MLMPDITKAKLAAAIHSALDSLIGESLTSMEDVRKLIEDKVRSVLNRIPVESRPSSFRIENLRLIEDRGIAFDLVTDSFVLEEMISGVYR
jgi:hypothetical protein